MIDLNVQRKSKLFTLFTILSISFVFAQTRTLTGTGTSAVITISGGSDSSLQTPADLIADSSLSSVVSAVGDRGVLISADLVIDGYWDDTGWYLEFADGFMFRKGTNADWVSGKEEYGFQLAGAVYSINGIGAVTADEGKKFNHSNGGNVYWRNVRVTTRGSNRSDISIISDDATNYNIDGLDLDTSLGALDNPILDFNVGTIKNVNIVRANLQLGGSGTIESLGHSGLLSSGTENKIFPRIDNYHFAKYKPYINTDGERVATGLHQISGTRSDQATIYFDDLVVPDFFDHTTDITVFRHGSLGRDSGKIIGRRTATINIFNALGAVLNGVRTYVVNPNDSNSISYNAILSGNSYDDFLQVYEGIRDNSSTGYELPTSVKNQQVKNFYYFIYGKQIGSAIGVDMRANSYSTSVFLLDDPNISQPDKSIVDAYTEIEALDKFYDRAAAWKVDNVADEYPAVGSQLITITGSTLDLGSQNLVIDASASQAFVVDTSTNTITLKANSITVGNGDYTSITTTGSISAQNGGEILFGYEDSNGKNIFVDFNWGTSDTYHVKIVDLNDNTVIATHNNQSNNYSGTFVAPTPFGSGAKIQLLNTGDNSVFYEANFTDENALTFARTSGSINDISTETTGVAQHEALFLARKILQKTESMAAALEGTTPTLADDTTTITEASSTVATKENQEAIRALLLRILTKTSASYEALKGAE